MLKNVSTKIGEVHITVGLIGFSDSGCSPGEHRVSDSEVFLEIVNTQTKQIIHEEGRPGKLVVTSLGRYLLPIVRYPVGDLCQWQESSVRPDRRYLLLGREPESWSLGSGSFSYRDVEEAMKRIDKKNQIRFQLVLNRVDGKDEVTLNIWSENKNENLNEQTVLKSLYRTLPKLQLSMQTQECNPVVINLINSESSLKNDRTGKIKRIIDNRN